MTRENFQRRLKCRNKRSYKKSDKNEREAYIMLHSPKKRISSGLLPLSSFQSVLRAYLVSYKTHDPQASVLLSKYL